MIKRFLSLLLVLALLLTCIPGALAADAVSGFRKTEAAPTTGGPLDLSETAPPDKAPVESSPAEPTESVPAAEPRIVNGAQERFSQTDAAVTYQPEDVVDFIVVLQDKPLLAAGFSASDIASATPAVTQYQNRQLQALATLKKALTVRFGADEDFRLGYSYTVAVTGLSVTTAYGNKAAIESLAGVDHVYVAPVFQLPEDDLPSSDVLKPMTSNATTMIGADIVNASGYTGKGMKVAILDTGIVVDHPNFQALPEDKLTADSLTKEGVDAIWDTLNASQSPLRNKSYYNSKLPFVFNYTTLDFDVSHNTARSDHGTHVAGIVAANKIDSSSVIGVAPDAQLVVMQVFTSTGAPWSTILAAMEDALRLNVNAVNLSLGSASGFTEVHDDMSAVLKLFEASDIEVCIAAGNDYFCGYQNLTGYSLSKAANPDIGLVGTPSTYPQALSVASVDNDGANLLYFTVNERKVGFTDSATQTVTKFQNSFSGKTLEFVAVGDNGSAAAFSQVDVKGKVALVSRGNSRPFTEMQDNAGAAGAVACVVYNNEPGILYMGINDGPGHIPCVAITQVDGAYLLEQLAAGNSSLTVCTGELISVHGGMLMSDFSSWGVTPDLKLKPEITGVGGNIYSSRDSSIAGSQYGNMSGTSMATPQVAGAMAVLMQYLRENTAYNAQELRQVAANLMMSTANPLRDGDLEYSPRKQGAGLVDLVKATTAQAYLTNPDAVEGRPKVELGDDQDRTGTYAFGFEIQNLSEDQDLTYSFDSSIFTETLVDGGYIGNKSYGLDAKVSFYHNTTADVLCFDFNDDGTITTADARCLLRHIDGAEAIAETSVHFPYMDVNGDGLINKADVNVIVDYCAEKAVGINMLETAKVTSAEPISSVTVPAGERVALVGRIHLSPADKTYLDDSFPNGMYVEGYLYAKAEDQGGVDLAMPILGFYGDWSDAPVYDEAGDDASLYPRRVFSNQSMIGTNPYFTGGRSGDAYNAISYANPLAELDFGMLRNAKRLTFSAVDTATKEEYFHLDGDYVTKSYFSADYGMIIPFYITDDGTGTYIWNGYDTNGNKLPDGTRVTYTVTAYLDDGDEVADDEWSFDLTLDNSAPTIDNRATLQNDLKLDVEHGKVQLPLTITENEHVAAVLFVNPDGVIMGKFEVDNTPGQAYTDTFDITGYGSDFTIVVADYACNETELDVSLDLGEMANVRPAVKQLDSNRLYGCETYDAGVVDSGWYSVNKADLSDPRNETYDRNSIYYSGEYINGYVIAERVDGALVLLTPYSTYWDTQVLQTQNGEVGDDGFIVLYDMALDYSETEPNPDEGISTKNNLYAVGWKYRGDSDGDGQDDGYNALFRIVCLYGNYWDFQEVAQISGTTGGDILTLGCTTEGQLYGIDTDSQLYRVDKTTGACSYVGTTDFVHAPNYKGANVIQSMAYDHNTKTMYWAAHSETVQAGVYTHACITYTVDLETAACTQVGSLGTNAATCLFVPTDRKSDFITMGVNPTGFSLEPATISLVQGQRKRVTPSWQPWNATGTITKWSSQDPEVATVNEAGIITGVGPGQTYIQAEAQIYNSWSGEWYTDTRTCSVTVLMSNDAIYAFDVSDFTNAEYMGSWLTFSDKTPKEASVIAKHYLDGVDQEGNPAKVLPQWSGGAYYNGYVYTVLYTQWMEDNVTCAGTMLYRMTVTKGETPEQTQLGQPVYIGRTAGVEVGNLGFDYNTGRMYGVDLTNGGLCIVDLETGGVDLLGTFQGDLGPAIMTAMCVDKDGHILGADMEGNLYLVDCDTLVCSRVGALDSPFWYYAGMTYDYNTGNIYWNPCMSAGSTPFYLVTLKEDEWEPGVFRAETIKLGSVGSKAGAELTAMFTIPDQEPETHFIPVEAIEITNGEHLNAVTNTVIQLKTQTTPLRPTSQQRVWTSSDESVVTVDAFGKVTCVGEGTATVTVTIYNRGENPTGPFSDTIEITVYQSAGDLEAFLGYDLDATRYYDFWVTVHDYDTMHTTPGERMISAYTLVSGEYYDGYYYAYDKFGNFLMINKENPLDYTALGKLNLPPDTEKVVDMAMDYTTGTMYGLTLSVKGSLGYLVRINLDNGTVEKLCQVDQVANTIAVDRTGTFYVSGSADAYTEAGLYELNPKTGQCEKITTLSGAYVGTIENVVEGNYAAARYNPQMTYDFTTDRLYLNATYYGEYEQTASGLYMIQLPRENTELFYVNLGKLALQLRGTPKVGSMFLSLMSAIPEEDEIPVGQVNGVLLNRDAARIQLGQTTQLEAKVRPSNAENQEIRWSSSNEAIAKVDSNGVITAVGVGTVSITATSAANSAISRSCTVTVVDLSGRPTSVAYTISADLEGLVSFNPALPGSSAELVSTISGGRNVRGMDVSGDNLYYLVSGPGFPELYRYDLVTKQTTYLGQLYVFIGEFSDMAYDPVEQMIYVVAGYYIFQFDLTRLDSSGVNQYVATFDFVDDLAETHAIAFRDGYVYCLAKRDSARIYKVDKDLKSKEVVISNLPINTVPEQCEMAYDSNEDLFYLTDAADHLYSFDLEGNVTLVDYVGDRVDINGLAIQAPAKQEP